MFMYIKTYRISTPICSAPGGGNWYVARRPICIVCTTPRGPRYITPDDSCVAGVALHTATAPYRVQARHIGGATFLTTAVSIVHS